MANFLKPFGSKGGYDTTTNTLTLGVFALSDVGLFGGGADGESLSVGPEDPTLAVITETPAVEKDIRTFSVWAAASGTTNLLARNARGEVWASMRLVIVASPPGPLVGPVAGATPSSRGQHKTTIVVPTGALKTPAFPPPYPSKLLTPSTKLQAALDRAIGIGSRWQVPVAVAALSDGPTSPHLVATFRGDEVHYAASLMKIVAMYSAYELRKTLRSIAAELGGSTTGPDLLKRAAAHLNPQIMANVATIPALAGVLEVHALPQYTRAFEVAPVRGAPGFTVELTRAFKTQLDLMIGDSVNDAAAQCVHGAGYGYINGALASGGFFDPSSNKGLWLAGDYIGQNPAFRIPSVNDGPSAQAATVRELVRLITLIHDGGLVSKQSSAEMRDLLTKPLASREVYSDQAAGLSFRVTHTKIGQGALKSNVLVQSEVALVAHDSGRTFAVAWQNYPRETTNGHDPIAFVLRDTMDEFLRA